MNQLRAASELLGTSLALGGGSGLHSPASTWAEGSDQALWDRKGLELRTPVLYKPELPVTATRHSRPRLRETHSEGPAVGFPPVGQKGEPCRGILYSCEKGPAALSERIESHFQLLQ